MKRFFKNNLCCFVSAFFAGAFYLFICFYYKIFPFGTDYTLLKLDLCHQYAPMLTQMYDLIKSGNGIFYSWSAGLGYSFFGNFLNYLASPFNLIILLFKRENVVDSISIIILLKTLFISGFFSRYLSKSFRRSDALNISFSLLYTFSGWFVAYNYNIMWLDVLYCLPLAALGVQRIINEKKPLLYILVLSYAMLTNYYTAYMLCIFVCIYFIYWYVLNNKVKKDFSGGFFKSNFFKSGLRFALSSLAAACISAVGLLPIFFLLRSSSAMGDSFNKGLQIYYDFFSFWGHQFSGSVPIITGEFRKNANAWCGMLSIILLPVYFISKRFSKKERIADFCLLAFLYFSLSINVLNYIWNGFHFANGLDDRFAFFYVFIALTIAFKAIAIIRELNKIHIMVSCLLSCAFIMIMRFAAPERIDKYTVLISMGFTAVWLIIYFVSGIKRIDRNLLKTVVLFFVCIEIVFSSLLDYDYNLGRYHYDRNYQSFSQAKHEIDVRDKDVFYRVEKTDSENRMEPMVMGYYGITNFSSVTKESVAKNQGALGMDSNAFNSFLYFYQTPVYNSIFGIKYIFDGDGSVKNKEYVDSVSGNGGYQVYKNKYNLSPGYCVNKTLTDFQSESAANPFYEQNMFFDLMAQSGYAFNNILPNVINTENAVVEKEENEKTQTTVLTAKLKDETNEGAVEYCFNIKSGEDCYIYLNYEPAGEGAELMGLDEEVLTSRDHSSGGTKTVNAVIPLGVQQEDTILKVKIPVNSKTEGEPIAVYLASFNKENFTEGYEKLSQHTLNLTEFENTHFKGTVTADEDCLLFTSIPYDMGWHITLDGEKVDAKDVIAIDDAYISVPLTKGEHTVEFDYFPQGLKAGAAVSVITVCGLIAYFIVRKKKYE